MFGGIGMQEILIVLIVGLLVFGAARLPKIARSLGLGIKEFKKTVKGLDDDSEDNQIKYVQNQPPISQQQYNPGMQQPGFTPNPQYYQNQPGGAGQPQAAGAGAGQTTGQPQTPGSGFGQAGVPPQAPGQAVNQNQAPGQATNQNQAPGQATNQNQAPGQATNQNPPQSDQQQSGDNQQNA